MTPTERKLTIGFSPCPNDTFIFHALVRGEAGDGCRLFGREVLEDVETLNRWALEGRLDVTKLSFHALGHVLDQYVLLTAGAALGRGCGPLLVAPDRVALADLAARPVAVPGRYTTAALLLRMFAPGIGRLVEMRFDEIMPAIATGKVAAGVIIHESRFTYRQHGLALLKDLGSWWEEVSGLPIPLGGIAARRSLGKEMIRKIDACVRESVRLALADPGRSFSYIQAHAQELEPRVIDDHIKLYVNSYSRKLGEEGLAAVNEFFRRGRKSGTLPEPEGTLPLSCLDL